MSDDQQLSDVEILTQTLHVVVDGLNKRFEHLESMHEQLEKVVAVLVPAYAEIAATIEALVARVGSGSPEELEAFQADAREAKRNMLEMFKSVVPQDPTGFQQFTPPA